MDSLDRLNLAMFALGMLLGVGAQVSRLCPYAGLRDLAKGQRASMAVYLGASGIAVLFLGAWIAATGQLIVPTRPNYAASILPFGRLLIGGMLLGVGLVLARACPLRATIRSAQGDLEAWLLLLMMTLGAYVMSRTDLYAIGFAPWLGTWSIDLHTMGIENQTLPALIGVSSPLPSGLTGVAIGTAIAVTAWRWAERPIRITRMWAATLVGACVAAGFLVTASEWGTEAMDEASFMATPPDGLGVLSFSYAGPLGDLAYFVMNPSRQTLSLSAIMVMGTLMGAFASGMLTRQFKLTARSTISSLPRLIVGALLVGAGAVLALGCTVGHGLAGLSILSSGSVIAIGTTFISAVATLRVLRAVRE